jgi:hypothetical protein
LTIDSLPKKQASRVYAVAQQREEHAREERRQRNLEEKRAAAGQFVTNVATPVTEPPSQPQATVPDPVETLRQLKAMLDAGLIEQAEFDAKEGRDPLTPLVFVDHIRMAQALEALGNEVIVADPNFAPMYATRSRRVKTDRRDARALADA